MSKMFATLLLLPLLLQACGPTYQETRQNQITSAKSACASYGYKRDTSEMSQCVQLEVAKIEAQRQRANDAMIQMGASMYQNATNPTGYNTPITTDCSQNGSHISCTTY